MKPLFVNTLDVCLFVCLSVCLSVCIVRTISCILYHIISYFTLLHTYLASTYIFWLLYFYFTLHWLRFFIFFFLTFILMPFLFCLSWVSLSITTVTNYTDRQTDKQNKFKISHPKENKYITGGRRTTTGGRTRSCTRGWLTFLILLLFFYSFGWEILNLFCLSVCLSV